MIVVFGSSGVVGRALLEELALGHEPVLALYRSHCPIHTNRAARARGARDVVDGSRMRRGGPSYAELESARVDLTTGEGVKEALRGARSVFLLTADMPDQAAAEIRVVEAAARARVPRIVKLSVRSAETEAFAYARTHRAVERVIEDSGMSFTFLRPGAFMQNFIHYHGEGIRRERCIRLPCADTREPLIDARDIARVAARCLVSDVYAGRVLELSGPEVLSYHHVAEKISAATGQTISYIPTSEEAYRASAAHVFSAEQLDELLELLRFHRERPPFAPTDTVREVTGRDPQTFDVFAREHAAEWTVSAVHEELRRA
ncbi:NmrA family NAD(P)-binding protein [Pendulispora albinea]|uniref:NmrA family NAD(P)-binding protein n=1 Tax=Pendulispora albinea TaxID=2741071 RepID=A0ABZ2LYT9_9BACT